MKPNLVYIFVGEEDLLKEEALSKLKKECFPSEDENFFSFNYISFDGKTSTSLQVVNEAQQLPFISNMRMIVVQQSSGLLNDTLMDYIQNPSPTTCLVLFVNKLDKRLSKYKILNKHAEIVEFSQLDNKTITNWIQKYISQASKNITPDNALLIADSLENNLRNVRQELDKLITYVGEKPSITEEDIKLMITENKLNGSFELTDAIQNKDSGRALNIVNNLLSQGKSIPEVTGLMRWMLTRLWKGKEIIESGDVNSLSRKLRIPGFFVSKFVNQANKFSTKEIKEGILKLFSLEKLMRTYSIPQKLILELFIVELTKQKTSAI